MIPELGRKSGRFFRVNWGAPLIIYSVILLAESALSHSSGGANDLVTYSFYALFLGIVFQIASYVRYGEGGPRESAKIPPVATQTPSLRRGPKMPIRITLTVILLTTIIAAGIGYYLYPMVSIGSNRTSSFLISTSSMPKITPTGDWPLDEGNGNLTHDTSGNGHDGTLINSPAWVAGSSCIFQSRCLNFSSSKHQFVSVPSSEADSFSISQSFSVCAWVSFNAIIPKQYTAIIAKSLANGTLSENYALELGRNGNFYAEMYNGVNSISVEADFAASPGIWYFACAVFDSNAQNLTLYVDVVSYGSASTSSLGPITIANSAPLTFGTNQGDAYLDGKESDCMIYNYALSSFEVLYLYNTIP